MVRLLPVMLLKTISPVITIGPFALMIERDSAKILPNMVTLVAPITAIGPMELNPSRPPKRTFPPAALSVKLKSPSTILLKVIFPPFEFMVVLEIKLTASVKETVSPVVVMEKGLPVTPKKTVPPPIWATVPSEVMLPVSCKIPALVMLTIPLLVVVTAAN